MILYLVTANIDLKKIEDVDIVLNEYHGCQTDCQARDINNGIQSVLKQIAQNDF